MKLNFKFFTFLIVTTLISSCEPDPVVQPIGEGTDDVNWEIPLSTISESFLESYSSKGRFNREKIVSALEVNYDINFAEVAGELSNNEIGANFFVQDSTNYSDSRMNSFWINFNFDYTLKYNLSSTSFSDQAAPHFTKLYNIIDPETETFSSGKQLVTTIKARLVTIRSQISSDSSLPSIDRSALLGAADAMRDNADQIVYFACKEFGGLNYEAFRTTGLSFKGLLRRVRSILVTTAVGFAVGFKAAGLVGGIIGGGVGLIGSVLDMAFNNACHYATKCGGGWRQNCDTGVCMNPKYSNTIGVGDQNYTLLGPMSVTMTQTQRPTNCSGCPSGNYRNQVNALDVYPFESQTQSLESYFSNLNIDTECVNMADAPANKPKTELGWPRDKDFFWQNYKDPRGALSSRNKAIIAQRGTPTVDAQWRSKIPWDANAPLNQVIEHHHFNQGRYAIPMSMETHRRIGSIFRGKLHPKIIKSVVFVKPTKESIFDKASKTIIGRLSLFADVIGLISDVHNEDPLHYLNIIYNYVDGGVLPTAINGYRKDRIYWLESVDVYLKVDDVATTYNPGGGGGYYSVFKYSLYENYGFDGSTKKYIGVGLIKKGSIGSSARIELD